MVVGLGIAVGGGGAEFSGIAGEDGVGGILRGRARFRGPVGIPPPNPNLGGGTRPRSEGAPRARPV